MPKQPSYLIHTDFEDGPEVRDLKELAAAWYDGGNSAMRKFGYGYPADARKLVKETRECIQAAEGTGHAELPRLRDLLAYAEKKLATFKLKDSIKASLFQAADAGIDHLDIRRWLDDAYPRAR